MNDDDLLTPVVVAEYVREQGLTCKPHKLDKHVFDTYRRENRFAKGPFMDSFGDGYGEPYNPHRVVFGQLNDGRLVWSKPTTSGWA